MMWSIQIRLWFVCFLCRKLPKRLKFNETDIYMLKVKKKSTRTRSVIFSKLTIKAPKRRKFSRSGVFIVNFEIILYLYIQKQSPRVVFQESSSTFSQFTGEHPCRSVILTLLKPHFSMGIPL